jgi:hypothetical protein
MKVKAYVVYSEQESCLCQEWLINQGITWSSAHYKQRVGIKKKLTNDDYVRVPFAFIVGLYNSIFFIRTLEELRTQEVIVHGVMNRKFPTKHIQIVDFNVVRRQQKIKQI